jgi:hypothetical protein
MQRAPASIFVSNRIFPIIRAVVCRHYDVPEHAISSSDKARAWVEPRFVCWWLARATANVTLHQLGRLAGGRDHSSCSHGIAKVEAQRAADPFLRQKIDEMWEEIAVEADHLIGPGAVLRPGEIPAVEAQHSLTPETEPQRAKTLEEILAKHSAKGAA